jgi:hypothetical protein
MGYYGTKQVAKVMLAMLLIFTSIQFIPIDKPFLENATASSSWFETDWTSSDNYASSSNIDTILSSGNIILSYNIDLYITDTANGRIVKTKMDGSSWTTYGTAGSGTGKFDYPAGISYDSSTDYIYVTDSNNDRIIKTKIDGSGWTTYGTDGSGTGQFASPKDISYDSSTDYLYVADSYNDRIVKTKIDGTGWTTLGSSSQFDLPYGIDHNSTSGYIFVADRFNDRIVKTKIDGSGWTSYGSSSFFSRPQGLGYDNSTDYLYVADTCNNRIVKMKLGGGGSTSYGSLGSGTGQFNNPYGVSCHGKTGYVYVADYYNDRIIRTQMDGSGWTAYGSKGSGIGQFYQPFKIAIDDKGLNPMGYLITNPYNIGSNSMLKTISWSAMTGPSTSIKFQIRSAATQAGLDSAVFSGPDGNTDTYYTSAGQSIWTGHEGDSWVQYKAILTTSDLTKTPTLEDVTIIFNNLPSTTLVTPIDKTLTTNNQPTFTWYYTDPDSTGQSAYQVLIDNDTTFQNVDYDTGEVTSTTTSYIPDSPIADGEWFWKVRVKDNDGNWGAYSNHWYMTIDTTSPANFNPTANPSYWSNNTQPMITFTTTDATSGVAYFNISIDQEPFTTQTSPYMIPPQDEGVHNITVRAYDHAGHFTEEYLDVFIDTVIPHSFIPIADPNTWTYNTQPLISFSTSDETSGIDHYEVKIDSGDFTDQSSPYTTPSQPDGTHNITVRAFDKAGNNVTGYINIYIDTVNPKSFTTTATPADWTTNTQPQISFSTTDDLSGLDHYELRVDQGTFSQVTNPHTLQPQTDGVHNITVRAFDQAGNYFEDDTKIYIDTTSPSITHTKVTSGTQGFPISITAIVTDEHSGIDSVLLNYKKPQDTEYSSQSMTLEGNIYSTKIPAEAITEDSIEYYLQAEDNSTPKNVIYFGLNGQTPYEPTSILDIDISITLEDETAPTITHVPISEGVLGQEMTITATVTDDSSGVNYVELYYKKQTETAYTKLSMVKKVNTYVIKIPLESVTRDGIGYYLKAADNATSTNIAYFGGNGQVSDEPTTLDDIDIIILEKDTTPPTIIDKFPTGNNVSVSTTIYVTYSEAMDYTAAESAFSINPGITGTTNWEDNKFIFTPDKAFNYQTNYNVTITANAKDLSGNKLESTFSWNFITTSTIDSIPPTVTDKNPNGTDVPLDTKISIKFSEPMIKEDTMNAFSITPIILGSYHWEQTTLIFSPNADLALDTTYNITLSKAAKDLVGNNLISEYSWEFTTTLESDTTPPKIDDNFPTGMNVPVNITISVTFSELMNESYTQSSFKMYPPVNGTFNWVGRTMIFTPNESLASETQYFVIITDKAKDLAGNNLREGGEWQFYTEQEQEDKLVGDDEGNDDDFWSTWEPIITVLTILASVIAFLFGFISIRRKRRRLRKYLDKIDEVYETHKNDFDECEKELKKLRDTIKSEVKDGKIEENHYIILNSRIREHIKDIRAAKKEAEAETDKTEPELKYSKCPKCEERFEIPYSDEEKIKIKCPKCNSKGKITNPYLNSNVIKKKRKELKSEPQIDKVDDSDEVDWK